MKSCMPKSKHEKKCYDVVMPSSYFVDRMQRQGLLETLDHSQLPNWQHMRHIFANPHTIKMNNIPFLIFGNRRHFL
jgi:spermidine/putrescine-binding protein